MWAFLGNSAVAISVLLLFLSGVTEWLYIRRGRSNNRSPRFAQLPFQLHLASWIVVSFAIGLLITLFITDSFGFSYVAERSHREMTLIYKISALWAGQEGSLLLWLWMQISFGLVIARRAATHNRHLDHGAAAVLSMIGVFFALLVTFVANPFTLRLPAPLNGSGLNPILQSYWMATHPIMLYLGYVGLSVPFAYAVSSLFTGESEWIKITRRWSLTAWVFLSIGILYGARWAYEELGWGGYWGWDPVENASLMPWLVATALIHSGIIEEKRGMLRRWNYFLVFFTYLLTIFGTFLTRSGILSSVHAFVESDIGPWFVAFLGIVTFVFLYLITVRWDQLQDERPIVSPVSKEASFLAQNVVFLATMFAVFWGTVFPLVASAFGRQVTVGTPYFNRVTGPLFWAMIVLMGIGPIISWRKSSKKRLKEGFLAPVINAVFMTVWLIVVGVRELSILMAMPAVVFVLTTILMEFVKGVRVRRRSRSEPWWLALYRLMNRSPGRYGGYVVHLGVLLLVVGIAFSSAYQQEKNVVLQPGESTSIGPFSVTLFGVQDVMHREVPAVEAELLVRNARGEAIGYVMPAKRFHFGFADTMGPTTQSAIHGTWHGDLYAILAGWEPYGSLVGLKLYYNPLVWLIWAGGGILAFGGIFSLWPRRQTMTADESAAITLVEVSDDFNMGKLDEEEYAKVAGQLSSRAKQYLKREQKAMLRVIAEIKDKIKGSATLSLWWIVFSIVTMGAAAGIVSSMSGNVLAQSAPPMGVDLATSAQTMFVRFDENRLYVFDHSIITHIGDTEGVHPTLSLPPGAGLLSMDPPSLEMTEAGLTDPDPMSPGETRRYVIQYDLPVRVWPFSFDRDVLYPTAQMTIMIVPDELQLSAIDVAFVGTTNVEDTVFAQYISEWIEQDTVWHVTLKPGSQTGDLAGWDDAVRDLPVLVEVDRFPGDWLIQRAIRHPGVSMVVIVIGVALAIWMRRRVQVINAQDASADLETLIRSVARLEMSYEAGSIGKRRFYMDRKRLFKRIEARMNWEDLQGIEQKLQDGIGDD